jgi:hypothetical protein
MRSSDVEQDDEKMRDGRRRPPGGSAAGIVMRHLRGRLTSEKQKPRASTRDEQLRDRQIGNDRMSKTRTLAGGSLSRGGDWREELKGHFIQFNI